MAYYVDIHLTFPARVQSFEQRRLYNHKRCILADMDLTKPVWEDP